MFAYCNNNPVNMSDQTGHRPLEITLGLFGLFLFGGGKNIQMNDASSLAAKFKKSKTMQSAINEEIKNFENGESYGTGTVHFKSNEPDLWLSARRANYDVSIVKETREVGFWVFKQTQTRYVAEVKVYDTYNFNIGNEKGDGIGSVLNNIGHWMEMNNIGNAYYWR